MNEIYVVFYDDGNVIGVAPTKEKADKIVKDDIGSMPWQDEDKQQAWEDYIDGENPFWFAKKVPFEG